MTTTFIVEELLFNEILKIRLKGPMSELSNFPVIDQSKVRQVNVDLEGVSYVNSFGIQRWVKWLREIKRDAPNVTIRIEKVSSVSVRSMAFVREFLPKAISVDSIYLSLACPNCDAQAEDLLIAKTSLRNAEAQIPKCKSCGTKLAPDTPIDQYMWFWKD